MRMSLPANWIWKIQGGIPPDFYISTSCLDIFSTLKPKQFEVLPYFTEDSGFHLLVRQNVFDFPDLILSLLLSFMVASGDLITFIAVCFCTFSVNGFWISFFIKSLGLFSPFEKYLLKQSVQSLSWCVFVGDGQSKTVTWLAILLPLRLPEWDTHISGDIKQIETSLPAHTQNRRPVLTIQSSREQSDCIHSGLYFDYAFPIWGPCLTLS